MGTGYCFRPLRTEEIPAMFQLILRRIQWMDERGIRQWNVTGYEQAYPLSYYEEIGAKGLLFALADKGTGRLCSAASLFETDHRWPDDPPALYLHNFISDEDFPGAGARFLEEAEAYARRLGKRYFRLDSPADNPALDDYYSVRGFQAVGTCQEGWYQGTLREKLL